MAETPVTGIGKASPLKIVLANGCFDILHKGHIEHLREARSMGDFLFVGLTMDEFVNKPGRPVVPWDDRAAVLRELRCVTAVIPCESGAKAILQANPQVFVKGCDYMDIGVLPSEMEACQRVGAEIRYTKSDKHSTTEIIGRFLTRQRELSNTMWHRTDESLPFKGEWLAVVHKLSSRGEYVHQDAMWDGEVWTERRSLEKLQKSHYYLWRRLET